MHLAIIGKAVFKHEEGYSDSLLKFAAHFRMCGPGAFTGELRNVSSVLQAADLLVLNSRQNHRARLGRGNVSGMPVLATRVEEYLSIQFREWLASRAARYARLGLKAPGVIA